MKKPITNGFEIGGKILKIIGELEDPKRAQNLKQPTMTLTLEFFQAEK